VPAKNDNAHIGVAVLGAASFAEEHHIPDTNSHPNAHVLALYSRGLDRAKEMAGRTGVHVRAAKGVHIVVPRDRIDGSIGVVVRTPESVLFIIPWGAHWLVGTTDTDWDHDLAHPAASQADIDYILEQTNKALRIPLTEDDIVGVYAGLRPLIHGEADATAKLSREHAVAEPVRGLVTIAGGKYTTYRIMARDTIDLVARELPTRVPRSCTHEIPLLGAEGFEAAWNRREVTASETGLHHSQVAHLLSRYGARVSELLELGAASPELLLPLEGAPAYIAAEVVYAASHEAALHLEDVLTRRTRISIETFDRGLEAAPHVAALMREVLGWNEATVEREIDHYAARVAAERDSQQQPDDRAADAARVGAEDVRMGGAGATRLEVVRGDRETHKAG